jgi:hypothetical protein
MATVFTKSTTPDLGKSVVHRVEELVLTVGAVGWIYDHALSVTIPSVTGGVANTTAEGHVDVTVTGVKVAGDVVVYANPTVALPANCVFVGAVVVADDTVRFSFITTTAGAITGAAKTFEVLIADRT